MAARRPRGDDGDQERDATPGDRASKGTTAAAIDGINDAAAAAGAGSSKRQRVQAPQQRAVLNAPPPNAPNAPSWQPALFNQPRDIKDVEDEQAIAWKQHMEELLGIVGEASPDELPAWQRWQKRQLSSLEKDQAQRQQQREQQQREQQQREQRQREQQQREQQQREQQQREQQQREQQQREQRQREQQQREQQQQQREQQQQQQQPAAVTADSLAAQFLQQASAAAERSESHWRRLDPGPALAAGGAQGECWPGQRRCRAHLLRVASAGCGCAPSVLDAASRQSSPHHTWASSQHPTKPHAAAAHLPSSGQALQPPAAAQRAVANGVTELLDMVTDIMNWSTSVGIEIALLGVKEGRSSGEAVLTAQQVAKEVANRMLAPLRRGLRRRSCAPTL
jgi:chemotaxis protein histidine kinase CheA